MIDVTTGVRLLHGTPEYLVNVYLVDNVLIDAGTKPATRGLLKQLKGHDVKYHALTHVHPDHQGASHPICEDRQIPLWCSEVEVDAMESGDMTGQIPRNIITTLQGMFWTGDAHPVDRGLVEGDLVAGFTVIDVPGHSPGHIAFWRESDGVLIAGDVLNNISFVTLQEGLRLPPDIFTMDAEQNLRSAQKLADLKPNIVCFGHGKPLMEGAKFVDFVQEMSEQSPVQS